LTANLVTNVPSSCFVSAADAAGSSSTRPAGVVIVGVTLT
jgi:hypothetical protein